MEITEFHDEITGTVNLNSLQVNLRGPVMTWQSTLGLARRGDPSNIALGMRCDEKGNPLDTPDHALAVPRKLLKEGHIHVRGRTRSGKTSLAIASLLQQLIRPYPLLNPRGEVIVPKMQDPIFIFDLGGDLSLFNYVRKDLCPTIYKDQSGNVIAPPRRFRFLSLKHKDNWDYFDPFQVVPDGERDLIRLAQLLIEAFNQDYGLLYGAAYYSMRSLSALIRVANTVVKRSDAGEPMDFRKVGKYLARERKPDRDEAQIRMAFQFLMNYHQLQAPPIGQESNQINMRTALDNSEVVYFFCPTMGQATTARQVAGLGLYTLLAAAQLRKDSGANHGAGHRHAWVIVDEFHELAGKSFASLLAQSSKFGISLILANQTTTQLETRDTDLASVVRDNCLAKIYFTVTGKRDFDELQGFSEEDLKSMPTSSTKTSNLDTSVSEGIIHQTTTKLRRDAILSTSATAKHCYVVLDDGGGHKEPQRIATDYTITEEKFLEHKNEPVPKRTHPIDAPTVEPKLATPNGTRQHQKPASTQAPSPLSEAALLTLLQEKIRQEDPRYIHSFYTPKSA